MTTQPAPDDALTEVHLDMSAARALQQREQTLRALESIGEEDAEQRAPLLAMLAISQSLTEPAVVGETLAAAHEAVDAAGTDTARAYLLLARFAVDLSPSALDERLTIATEAMRLLARIDDRDAAGTLGPATYFAYLSALTESGDVDALDRALSPEAHLDDHLTPLLNHRFASWFRCSRATMDGQLATAERLAGEGYARAIEVGDVDAETVWAGQTAVVRWMQGRISEMEPVFLHARRADPTEPVWGATVAWIWVHQGRMRAARGLVNSLPEVEHLTGGRNYLATLTLLAEVIASVGTADENDRLAAALLPFSDRVVTMGLGITSWGTVARPLALLARARGDVQTACRWYEASIELCSSIGAQPWLARAQAELASIHVDLGEWPVARELIGESVAAARSLGLRYIEQQADRLLRRMAAGPGGGAPLDGDAPLVEAGGGGAHADGGARTRSDGEGTPRSSAFGPVPSLSQGELARPGWAHSVAPDGGVGRSGHVASGPVTSGHVASGPVTSGYRHTRISVLGDFAVTYPDGTRASWKSRKAATLLKILLARRGATLARETAMDLLWPDQDPGRLANRLSVALTAVRRSLDPGREHPANAFVAAATGTLRLHVDRLSIDVEDFFALAERARNTPESHVEERESLLRATIAAYTGDALADEPYAAWAEQLREQAHLTFFGASHALAELVGSHGDHLQQVELYRAIVALDPYDMAAHDGLASALEALGAAGHLAAARAARHERMAELGLAAG